MIKKYNSILLFGPPGTGKGTQAKLLAQTGKYFHFSTGDMFRNLNLKTKTGTEINNLMGKGELISDKLTLKLFDDTLQNCVRNKRYDPQTQVLILDGIPRTLIQAELIKNVVTINKIIFINTNYETVIKRNTKRAEKENRSDDNKGLIKKRIESYKAETLPILECYKKDLVIEIDGLGTEEEVHERILNALKNTS